MPPPATEQVWTLGSLLDWTAKHLAAKGVESARLDAEVLLAHAVGCKRIDLYGTRHGDVAPPEVKQQYRELIRQRLEGCPVAYLVGRKEFYGLELKVSPAVLIPPVAVRFTVLFARMSPAAAIVSVPPPLAVANSPTVPPPVVVSFSLSTMSFAVTDTPIPVVVFSASVPPTVKAPPLNVAVV